MSDPTHLILNYILMELGKDTKIHIERHITNTGGRETNRETYIETHTETERQRQKKKKNIVRRTQTGQLQLRQLTHDPQRQQT